MNPTETPLMDDLRALLCVRASHGEIERLARVAGIEPRRLSNCLNPDQPHKLGLDESASVVKAGLELGLPGMLAFAARLQEFLTVHTPTQRRRNGFWSDEPGAVLNEGSRIVLEYGRTPDVKSLSLRDREEMRGALLRCRDLIDAGLQELER